MSSAALLHGRFERRQAPVAVVGLGHVGLPLAAAIATAGHPVIGVDTAPEVVEAVSLGDPGYVGPPAATLAGMAWSGRLRATLDFGHVADAGAVFICVPTPLDANRRPDVSHLREAAESLAASLRGPVLVILESTTYPGTTEELLVPTLTASGLRLDHDLFVAYSPERIDPGNGRWTIANTPKLVAGVTPDSTRLALALYGTFVDRPVAVANPRTAELAKLFENVFRFVNIALANELQHVCEALDLDVWEVLEASATKPFGFMPFRPGPGPGGHCIPIDPLYLTDAARRLGVSTPLLETADRVNASMPGHVAGKVLALLQRREVPVSCARVGLIGVAYKPDVGDTRESPAAQIIALLRRAGAEVTYHDPLVPRLRLDGVVMESSRLNEDFLASLDAIVIVTDHSVIPWRRLRPHAARVIDTRGRLRRSATSDDGPPDDDRPAQ